ncbi:large ribosomal subunit protein mL37 isoform X2 [Anabrus simplex]|uniref:large ribosomal subunit protein mL37 isoform X2 n=1 Tax=Anabrus simplex TaxID=316456 RepID=UPI0035A2F31D
MRLTLTVCRQHLGRMFKKHWKIQGQKPILDTGAEKELSKLGISVQQAEDVLREKIKKEKIEIIGFEGNQPPKIEHVPRHENTCYVYRDHNVLLEGLEQAKLLTKTVEIQNSFPEALQNPPANDHLPDLDELVQRYVLTSHVFNATQEFLPRIHDPVRPAFNFPRVMGIPDSRSSSLLYMKFLHLSEAIMGKSLGMSSVNDSFFAVPLEKDGNTLQFEVTADLLLTSSRYLSPIADREAVKEAQNIPLPDLHPIMPVISLEKEEAYEIKDLYPVDVDGDFPSIHTAVVFYDKEKVQNLFATPVTETQILGRSLMHSFTMASAQARQTFGVAVPCHQSASGTVATPLQTCAKEEQWSIWFLSSEDVMKCGLRRALVQVFLADAVG